MTTPPIDVRTLDTPPRHDLDVYVGGKGGAHWLEGNLATASGAVDLTGSTISAEMRDLFERDIPGISADIIDAPLGGIRVSIDADRAREMAVYLNARPSERRGRIGRYAVYLSGDAGRWCIFCGDVWGVR